MSKQTQIDVMLTVLIGAVFLAGYGFVQAVVALGEVASR